MARKVTIYAPNTDYSGISAGVQFERGKATVDADHPQLGWFGSSGYSIGSPPSTPAVAGVVADARAHDGPEVLGTPLRDAAVNPKPTDFLPPTNAGRADPHGPLVVAPSIHAVGPAPINPGPVSSVAQEQDNAETRLARAVLVDGKPATMIAQTGGEDTGALGLSDPGSAAAGAAAAAEVRKASGQAGTEPTRNATQAAWVNYAVAKGASREDVQDLSRADLIERFGAAEPTPAMATVTSAAANDQTPAEQAAMDGATPAADATSGAEPVDTGSDTSAPTQDGRQPSDAQQ